jgi:hypothetical protein
MPSRFERKPQLKCVNELRSWEFFSPLRHVKDLTLEKVSASYHFKTPGAVDNFYAWNHKHKLNHVCKELKTAFGPDNDLDRLLRLSIDEMNKTSLLSGPEIYLPNLNHSLVDALLLAEADATQLAVWAPLADEMPLVDVMVPMCWVFQALT